MFQNPSDLAAMAEALSQSTDYRVLRRLVPRPTSQPAFGQEVRTGILLDTETTGLDHAKDEIIELGMVKFDYTPEVRIVGLRDAFSAFNEPSAPISAEARRRRRDQRPSIAPRPGLALAPGGAGVRLHAEHQSGRALDPRARPHALGRPDGAQGRCPRRPRVLNAMPLPEITRYLRQKRRSFARAA